MVCIRICWQLQLLLVLLLLLLLLALVVLVLLLLLLVRRCPVAMIMRVAGLISAAGEDSAWHILRERERRVHTHYEMRGCC